MFCLRWRKTALRGKFFCRVGKPFIIHQPDLDLVDDVTAITRHMVRGLQGVVGGPERLGVIVELQAQQAKNRFFQDLEEWLSGVTRLGSGGPISDGDQPVPAYIQALLEQTADSLENLQRTLARGEDSLGHVLAEECPAEHMHVRVVLGLHAITPEVGEQPEPSWAVLAAEGCGHPAYLANVLPQLRLGEVALGHHK